MENQLIINYLLQQLSEEESERIALWLQEDKANQEFLFSLEELYWANQMDEMKRLANTNQEWKRLEYSILKKQKRSVPVFSFLKYAALIALLLALPFTLYKAGFLNRKNQTDSTQWVTTATEKGGHARLTLPDGTNVWLNSGSSLTYNPVFVAERQVRLTGEAYFEVTSDEQHPFVVSTSLMDVKVLGTKFNLRAFSEENQVRTTLYEGRIAARIADASFKQEIMLNPGEQLTYGKNKTLSIAAAPGQNDSGWKDGVLLFRKQALRDIVRELERTFNVEIVVADEKLTKELFTCEFRNGENLNDILNLLKMTKKLDYSINGSKVKIVPSN